MLGESPWRETLAQVPITWVIVDERYVPYDDPQSNEGMIQRTLFANGISPGHCFLPFRTDLEPEACAATPEMPRARPRPPCSPLPVRPTG